MAYDQKRLDTLIRQGMMPAKQLPILKRALDKLKGGQIPNPYEREAISKLLDKTLGFQFGDDVTYNRARLHTQRTRYQTEEKKMADKEGDVVVYDGSEDEAEAKRDKKVKKNGKSYNLKSKNGNGEEVKEDVKAELASIQKDKKVQSTKAAARPADEGQTEGDKESPKQGSSKVPEVGQLSEPQDSKPVMKEGLVSDLDSEGMRSRASRLMRKRGKVSKERLAKDMPAAVRKEKQKAGLSEDLKKFNKLYNENLQRALANNKVDNVRDIPEKIKADLFKHVEEATYSDKQIKMAKGIAFDKRYKGGNMTGAAKQMEKIKKGLSDHPKVSNALRQANEEVLDEKMASKDHDGDGKIESGKDEYFGSKDKAIKKAMKKQVKEEDIKKTPNQAVRDVHRTVADVLAGKSIEVSDEPLVTDPSMEMNKGTGNHFDVQEGAREDAMRDMKSKDATKGMAPIKKEPKPGKSKHDGSENKGPEHIVAQLRKAVSLGDKHDGVKFQDGKTHKVKAHHAQKFLNKYMSGKPADKEKMQSHGHASHDNFKKHLD